MGYKTRYELDWSPWSAETDIVVAELISSSGGMSYALMPDGTARLRCKWYDHVKDIADLSKKCPGVTFHLSGEGEDAGDIWDAYALDGKVQKWFRFGEYLSVEIDTEAGTCVVLSRVNCG